MANTATAALPEPQAAYETLFSDLQAQAFFHKLAAVAPQYYPRTQQEAQDLLDMGAALESYEQHQAIQKVANDASPLGMAKQALYQILAAQGVAVPAQQASERDNRQAIQKAAADFAADPHYYNAALSLAAYQADQIRQRLTAAA